MLFIVSPQTVDIFENEPPLRKQQIHTPLRKRELYRITNGFVAVVKLGMQKRQYFIVFNVHSHTVIALLFVHNLCSFQELSSYTTEKRRVGRRKTLATHQICLCLFIRMLISCKFSKHGRKSENVDYSVQQYLM